MQLGTYAYTYVLNNLIYILLSCPNNALREWKRDSTNVLVHVRNSCGQ